MNHEQINAIAEVLRKSPSLTEVEIRNSGGVALRLRRPLRRISSAAASPSPAIPAVAPPGDVAAAAVMTEAGSNVKNSPLTASVVGIFRALTGDATITVGTAVKEGQIIGHIEAMRLLNDCLAPQSGTITSVVVEEGQPVEYGQLLFEIGPVS